MISKIKYRQDKGISDIIRKKTGDAFAMCTAPPTHHRIFCQNIAWLRQHHNLTQKEMAQRLGIGVKRLRSIEKGVMPRRLSAEILIRISDEFDILPSAVLGTNLWEGPLV